MPSLNKLINSNQTLESTQAYSTSIKQPGIKVYGQLADGPTRRRIKLSRLYWISCIGLTTNSPTSLLDFIRRVGVGELTGYRHKCFATGQSHTAEDCYMYIPLPLENSDKQLPKLDFFPQIVSVLVFPSTSFIKAENTLCEQMIGQLGFLQMHIDNHQKELIHTLPNTHNCKCRTHSPTMNLLK